jgi:hypothetical protein
MIRYARVLSALLVALMIASALADIGPPWP